MEHRGWVLAYCILLCTVTVPAQKFTKIVDFDSDNGASPDGTLIQGADGRLYGTTYGGGNPPCGRQNGCGTIFRISAVGTLITLHSFDGTEGTNPYAGLVQGLDRTFYGTTLNGGIFACNPPDGCGTVFKLTAQGTLTTLYRFCAKPDCPDGSVPSGGLVQGADGSLYGTTVSGGDPNCHPPYGCGTVFTITPAGKLTTLHVFLRQEDGSGPIGALIEGTDKIFYGTTSSGGNNACGSPSGCGTVFKISRSGSFTKLHTFTGNDGCFPYGRLFQAADGNFYGTTEAGGLGGCSNGSGFGTAFKLTPQGLFTTLHAFGGGQGEGSHPYGGLVEGTDGNLYGTTSQGGEYNHGTVFKLDLTGTLTTLYSFAGTDGAIPDSGIIQSTSGAFFGSADRGGVFGDGTLYRLDVGLRPFVSLARESGIVGSVTGLLGQTVDETTSVSFDGTDAQFTIVSSTFLKATVPAGATTGFVTVTTPSGTLTSNKPFRVTPQVLSFDPPTGAVGTQVTITGVSLTQTQGVGFGDRVPAQFTVSSDTQVTAVVPAGAKTGRIGIETKGGTAISAGVFTVTP